MVPENDSINLYSPNYPGQYPDNTHCEVNISAPQPSSRLSVAITNFDIENGDNCEYDYLHVANIGTGKLCGLIDGLDFNRTSYKSWVTLLFVSDSSQGGTGYEAEFRVIENQEHQIIPGMYCNITWDYN